MHKAKCVARSLSKRWTPMENVKQLVNPNVTERNSYAVDKDPNVVDHDNRMQLTTIHAHGLRSTATRFEIK